MGTLYVVSTPIGNLEDITIRAVKTLFSVDIIACEDTRRTGILLGEMMKLYRSVVPSLVENSTIQLNPSFRKAEGKRRYRSVSRNKTDIQLIRFDDQKEQRKTSAIIHYLQEGNNVALISDAGTPLICDPGFLLVREALKRGITVTSIPGPTAAIAALTVSGLPTHSFLFFGYPPEKKSRRTKLFNALFRCFKTAEQKHTYIFYCAPHKLQQTLEDMKEVFGNIPIVIARELTKIHEEVWTGSMSEAQKHFESPQGEFVLLINI